ncbi:hypothetical protein LguiA_003138 [Lonicera macranthoides]
MSRETIKPASPTPSNLQHYNLAPLDLLSFTNYVPLVLFYPNNGSESSQNSAADRSRRLKQSLSETLTKYYPFAGRLTSAGSYIHCNDDGVEFQETRVECKLVDVLEKPGYVDLQLLFPAGLVWGNVDENSALVVVQHSLFECGGTSIGICMSHKMADAATLSTFLTYWAAVTRQSGEQVSPHFITFPAKDSIIAPNFLRPKKYWVTMKFVFPNSKISHLKAILSTSESQNPSRVDVLTALLYKCAMGAVKASSGSFKASVLFHAVNMRLKMSQLLSEASVGNLCLQLDVPAATENESNMNELTNKIMKGKLQLEGVKDLEGKELGAMIHDYVKRGYNLYFCSSLCNFPFYELDFGWGMPGKVNIVDTLVHNIFYLMTLRMAMASKHW